MRQAQTVLSLSTQGQRFYEITDQVQAWLPETKISTGLLTVFCRHTSASLTIQENADADVQRDLGEFFRRLVPENDPWYRHTAEGPDDMPAHIKSALTDVSLTIPLAQGRMVLGTWQGIYLIEHRHRPHRREVILHLLGD